MIITRRHGSWVVLGTLVTDVEIEQTPPLALDCGECRLCIDACPTGALDEPGVARLDACLSYWTQSRAGRSPRRIAPSSATRSTAATSARTSARGTGGSRSAAPAGRSGRRRARRVARRLARDRPGRALTPLRPPLRAAKRRPLPAAERPHRANAQTSRSSARRRPVLASTPSGRRAPPERAARRDRAAERAERARAPRDELAQVVGSTTTASPRKRRISLTSHSGLPTSPPSSAVPSASSAAPRSTSQRATAGEYQIRADARVAQPLGLEALARLEGLAGGPRARASGRAGSSAGRRGCDPTCGRTSTGSSRSSTYGSTRCVHGLLLALLPVLDLDQLAALDRVAQRRDQRLLGLVGCGRRGLRELELAERLLELAGARARAACAPRRRSSARRTRARAGSRAPRAASAAAASGTCRRTAPCRRAPRRRAAPRRPRSSRRRS